MLQKDPHLLPRMLPLGEAFGGSPYLCTGTSSEEAPKGRGRAPPSTSFPQGWPFPPVMIRPDPGTCALSHTPPASSRLLRLCPYLSGISVELLGVTPCHEKHFPEGFPPGVTSFGIPESRRLPQNPWGCGETGGGEGDNGGGRSKGKFAQHLTSRVPSTVSSSAQTRPGNQRGPAGSPTPECWEERRAPGRKGQGRRRGGKHSHLRPGKAQEACRKPEYGGPALSQKDIQIPTCCQEVLTLPLISF